MKNKDKEITTKKALGILCLMFCCMLVAGAGFAIAIKHPLLLPVGLTVYVAMIYFMPTVKVKCDCDNCSNK